MLNRRLLTFTAVTALLASAFNASAAEPAKRVESSKPSKTGYITASGIKYYYEIHGKGEPLLLLHGGLGHTGMFGPTLAALAQNRQVIGVDLQGHGHTALGESGISLTRMADDMAVIVKELGYKRLDAMGYSMGGGVAFRFAVQHPELVRRLVLVSAGFAQNGFYPEMLPMQSQVNAAMADAMKGTPMYESYIAVAPHPEDFPKLLDRMGEQMRVAYDWSEDVKKLTMPTMIIFGDSDMYRPEHVIQFYQLLGGGLRDAGWGGENMSRNRLAILPGLTHYDIFLSPMLSTTALPFLNGETKQKSWSEQVQQTH